MPFSQTQPLHEKSDSLVPEVPLKELLHHSISLSMPKGSFLLLSCGGQVPCSLSPNHPILLLLQELLPSLVTRACDATSTKKLLFIPCFISCHFLLSLCLLRSNQTFIHLHPPSPQASLNSEIFYITVYTIWIKETLEEIGLGLGESGRKKLL